MFKTVELGEVLNYEQPTRYIVESDIYNDEYDVPVLTAGKSFILGYTNEKENIYQNYPVIIFDDFTTATKYVDFPFKVKSSAMKILSCDENIADIKFLFYLIQTIKINSEQHQRYWISKFSKIQIPLPSLVTQKAIAEKLDKADALRKKDQELLKQYDELAQSIFIEMFGDPVQNEKGWEKIQLGNFITTLVDVGSNGANDWVSANIKMKDEEDYAMMIRTTNLSNNDFSDNLKYVTEETYNLFKKTKVFGGEVIMNKIGSAGDFWIMPNLNRPVSLGLNQLMFEFENLNTLFFKHYFSTDYGVKLIKSNLRGAITKSITKTALRELEIYNVPLELQNQFAEKIKNIEAQKELVKKQAEASENLFQALLQESFSFT
ncbi:restriction endonuclease subunit S [Empedobacter sp. ULE_I145]